MDKYPIHGSKYFDVREFVDSKTFAMLGARAEILIDPKIVRIVDNLREIAASPLYLNNWHTNGKRRACGYRAHWEKQGGDLSQHRCGRAADPRSLTYTPKKLFEMVMDHRLDFFELGLTRIEDLKYTPTWLHLDCAPVLIKPGEFLIVKPL